MAKRRFTLFPKLPIEVRDEIWRMTLEPRLVEVRPKSGKCEGFNSPKSDKYEGFYAAAPLPIVLTVCQDSRRAVLPLYPKCFGGLVIPPQIRINFELDTLFLDWKLQERLAQFLLLISVQEAEKIRYLAIDQYIRWGRFSSNITNQFFQWNITLYSLQRCPRQHDGIYLDDGRCVVEWEDLELLCSTVRRMPRLRELIFVQVDFGVEGCVEQPETDHLAGLTMFESNEELISNLFSKTTDPNHDYRDLIWVNDEDRADSLYENMEEEMTTMFEMDAKFLFRYGWRFPDSLTNSPLRPQSPGYMEYIFGPRVDFKS